MHQLRVVEKRLLVRVKDRNPAPLSNLELLLEGTHAQLMALAEQALVIVTVLVMVIVILGTHAQLMALAEQVIVTVTLLVMVIVVL